MDKKVGGMGECMGKTKCAVQAFWRAEYAAAQIQSG